MTIDPAVVGTELPTITETVERGRLRFFAQAIGETDPVYTDLAAAEAAASGAGTQQVLSVLDRRLRATTQMIYVDTLEYLRRSGRIGRAQAMLGQALSIKPVLVLREGVLEPMAKGRGPDRALKKAVKQAVQRAGAGQVDIGIEHFQYAERAHEVANELRRHLPQVRNVVVAETSAIIGAHAGPGALGITISPVV